MTTHIDPRLVALEAWMSTMHGSIFDTSMHAQAVVSKAQQTMTDIDENNDDFIQLKRDFAVNCNVYQGKHHATDELIDATEKMAQRADIPRLHFAQIYAAGSCAITCQRMLDTIPDDLHSDETVIGGLQEKAQGHFTMWRHLVGAVTPN